MKQKRFKLSTYIIFGILLLLALWALLMPIVLFKPVG